MPNRNNVFAITEQNRQSNQTLASCRPVLACASDSNAQKGRLCEGLSNVDTHLDHHDRSIAHLDDQGVPEALLCHTQLTAMDFLERCVREFEPLAALVGDAGTGKTTALDAALARRDRAGDRIIRARHFPAGPLSLHRALTAALGVADAGALSAEQLEQALRRALTDAGEATPPVLAVDNAHALPPETLRYLSLLAGLREAGRPLFRILLVGRSGFAPPQVVPVQYTLGPVHPAAARQVAEQRLAAAGLTLDDGAVLAIVRHARGNLGRLDAALNLRIDQAQRESKRFWRLASVATQTGVATRRLLAGGQPRWQDTLSAAAALLAVSIATAVIGTHTGASPQPGAQAAVIAAQAPHPSPVPRRSPAPMPIRVADLAPAKPSAAPILAPATGSAPSGTPSPQPDAPLARLPEKPSAATAVPVPAAAPAPQVTPPPAPQVIAPVMLSETTPSVAPPPVPRQPVGHFRVNNVSSCHHGVCPRWSVTDVDRHTHGFAAFDPTPLHLDRDTLQRLRQGNLELTVTGTVRKHGPDGQTLVADSLQSTAPHHGHRPQSNDATASQDPSGGQEQ